jgi:hypothetical protein
MWVLKTMKENRIISTDLPRVFEKHKHLMGVRHK